MRHKDNKKQEEQIKEMDSKNVKSQEFIVQLEDEIRNVINDCEKQKKLASDAEEQLITKLGLNKDLILKCRQLENEVREMQDSLDTED